MGRRADRGAGEPNRPILTVGSSNALRKASGAPILSTTGAAQYELKRTSLRRYNIHGSCPCPGHFFALGPDAYGAHLT